MGVFQGGEVSVQAVLEETKVACEIPNSEQPFACMDLSFIAALLTHGYGLKGDSVISLYKRIDNHEVSWGMGLAFHIVNNGIGS